MKNKWKKPAAASLSDYQRSVIALVPEGNVPKIMEANEKKLLKLLKNVPKKN